MTASRFTHEELRVLQTCVVAMSADVWDDDTHGPRPDLEALIGKLGEMMAARKVKLSSIQDHHLRWAAQVPSILTSESGFKPTIAALLRKGLIESGGVHSAGEGFAVQSYLITDLGRMTLEEVR
jgi:hypothetical protein